MTELRTLVTKPNSSHMFAVLLSNGNSLRIRADEFYPTYTADVDAVLQYVFTVKNKNVFVIDAIKINVIIREDASSADDVFEQVKKRLPRKPKKAKKAKAEAVADEHV